jgi:hypothetical protein
VLLSRVWSGWRDAVQIAKPATVVSWHRRVFAWHWRWRSAQSRLGRPPIAVDIRALIRQMYRANPIWGPSSPSPTWRTFLRTLLSQCASMDFFTVSTATFRILFVW